MNTSVKIYAVALITAFYASVSSAAETSHDKDHQTKGTTSPSHLAQLNEAPVEPLGLEKGAIVDGPANLADKVGTKINTLFGNDAETDHPSSGTANAKQNIKPNEAPVEPLGLEKGAVVDGPANLADRIGNKINSLLGNDT